MIKTASLHNPFLGLFGSKTKRQPYLEQVNPVVFWVSATLLLLNVIFLMSYVSSVNKNSLQGYEMKKMQARLGQLSEENKYLNIKISESSSIVNIQSDFLNSNFVSVGTPIFLSNPLNTTASR